MMGKTLLDKIWDADGKLWFRNRGRNRKNAYDGETGIFVLF